MTRHRRGSFLLLAAVALASHKDVASGFVVKPQAGRVSSVLQSSRRDTVDGDLPKLYERLQAARLGILEDELTRPPNPSLEPTEFVNKILEGLLDMDDPLPDAGFRRLLRASTEEWRARIFHSIGADPERASNEIVASALGTAIARPNNQFGILVGADDSEQYTVSFPSDALDFEDGTAWIECRLRSKNDNSLLVAMGWELRKRPSDGAWLVDSIDWQDFRDSYRPGIGREEWMSIWG